MIKEEIKEIIETAYTRDNWVGLIRNVFNNGQFNANPAKISIGKNDIAENAFELGAFETVDERIIGIYEIKVKPDINLERNRVSLRQLLRNVYKQVDGAFIVFNQDKRWRFSYVSEISSRDENGKLVKSHTEPKRFTYLFGEGLSNRTAVDRFHKLSGKPIPLEEIKESFSVDTLTKEFYKELSDWYFWALQHVQFPDDQEKDKEIRNSTNTIRLITRLMFVWFLKQKKLIPEELFSKEEIDKLIKYNDKEESTYYKAILQNLFFATLNTEMGDSNRKFVDRQYGIQGYYRYKRFFKDADNFLKITKNVPFLNGGLFENLDKNVGTKDEMRIDCFSNRLENESRLSVPDYLFFGKDTVDLSTIYDDKKKNHVEVSGLISILKKYNFTIEENTPLDVEVALDPELLGKVFENLLASYNPETKNTARKQTGSFYTPREVVGYMVDESLKTHLLQKLLDRPTGFIELGKHQTELLGNEGKKGQLSIKQEIKENDTEKIYYEGLLASLLKYSNNIHGFNENEIDIIISAIDNCKILDPACGSGAFPMGILHKMVHILHKLDPKNEKWKEKQILRVESARNAASEIQDLTAREHHLIELNKTEDDIQKAFANNELDYGRKLYLIENCIYGVDIQPIAVQIAKLRFFISLIVDQTIHKNEPNLGIRPLPNLETKFVAANTLIDLEKENNNLFTNPQIDKKKSELKRVRLDHFEAKTPGRKSILRKKDELLRKEISELLVHEHELQPKTAKLLANWNPYDQNASATFFDSEWMFGITNGFDIIIGNPPYLRVQGIRDANSLLADELIKKYKSATGSFDLYALFSEKGLSLINPNGIVNYIMPVKWTNAAFGSGLREIISQTNSAYKIINFGAYQVFNASTYTGIQWFRRGSDYLLYSELNRDLTSTGELSNYLNSLSSGIYAKISADKLKKDSWVLAVGKTSEILTRLNQHPRRLSDIFEKIFQGLATSKDDVYFLYDCVKKGNYITGVSKQLNASVKIEQEFTKPLLKGDDVHRYEFIKADKVVIFPYKLINGATDLYSEEEIKSDFPYAYSYLKRCEDVLRDREKGRFNIDGEWFQYGRKQGISSAGKEKLLAPEISLGGNFVYDEKGGFYSTTKIYGYIKNETVEEGYKFWLGLLNSRLFWFFIQQTGYILRGGYFTFKTNYVHPFPIPGSIPKDVVLSVENIVTEILSAKKISPSADISKQEEKIDDLIFKLYGLSRLEIQTILKSISR